MKVSKVKAGLIIVFSIIILVAVVSYVRFIKLDIYHQEANGDIISPSGVVYQFNMELASSYGGGELKPDKVIGRFEGKTYFETFFFGTRIIKLKGYDGKDTFLVRGLMLQEVYTKKDK